MDERLKREALAAMMGAKAAPIPLAFLSRSCKSRHAPERPAFPVRGLWRDRSGAWQADEESCKERLRPYIL